MLMITNKILRVVLLSLICVELVACQKPTPPPQQSRPGITCYRNDPGQVVCYRHPVYQ